MYEVKVVRGDQNHMILFNSPKSRQYPILYLNHSSVTGMFRASHSQLSASSEPQQAIQDDIPVK